MKFTTSFLIDCIIDHQRVVLDLLQKDGAVYILSSNSPMGYQSTSYTVDKNAKHFNELIGDWSPFKGQTVLTSR